MTVQFGGFAGPSTAVSGRILVGLNGSTCTQFYAQSFLFAAGNLSDVANKTTAFDNVSPLSTAGDLLLFTGGHSARLACGTTGQILSVTGANTVAWAANPGALKANNLSDLASISTALVNLGLDPGSTATFNAVISTTSVTGATLVANTSSTSPSFISTALNVDSVANALTAHAGGGQGSALALTKSINRVTTVATAGDSVALPAATAGRSVTVINAAAANSMNCFPASGDAINALSANTQLAIAANKTATFYCAVNGTWNSLVTA